MKNITVSIDEDTYRRARIRAAEQGASVSALVRRFLAQIGSGESDFERKKRAEAGLRNSIVGFKASDRISRYELHDRKSR